jgi:predicted ribosome-associated RNA-binding protein Tma20
MKEVILLQDEDLNRLEKRFELQKKKIEDLEKRINKIEEKLVKKEEEEMQEEKEDEFVLSDVNKTILGEKEK